MLQQRLAWRWARAVAVAAGALVLGLVGLYSPAAIAHAAPRAPAAQGTSLTCGKGWQVVPSPNAGITDTLDAVAAVSANNVWAVGGSILPNGTGQTLIEHWDGTNWQVVPSPDPGVDNYLNGVAVVSASSVWAVGTYFSAAYNNAYTLVEHWNGANWQVVSSPNVGTVRSFLNSVAVVSADSIWAVGEYVRSTTAVPQTLVEHWNGSLWQVVPSPNYQQSGTLTGVAVVSANNIWAVGLTVVNVDVDHTLIEHWNGTVWNLVPSGNVGDITNNNALTGVTGIPGSPTIWAVGWDYHFSRENALIERWNGTRWLIVPSPLIGSGTYLGGVTALSASSVWAVGFHSGKGVYQPLIEHWNDTSWQVVSNPTVGTGSSGLTSIASVSATGILWVVGSSNSGTRSRTLTMVRC